jgi:hypothetical protein
MQAVTQLNVEIVKGFEYFLYFLTTQGKYCIPVNFHIEALIVYRSSEAVAGSMVPRCAVGMSLITKECNVSKI